MMRMFEKIKKQKYRAIGIPFLGLLLVGILSCDINQKDIKPEDEFVKIYHHPDEALRFFPQSVEQISDGGYVILCGVKSDTAENEFPTSYLIGVNSAGEISWTDENSFLAPEGKLLKNGNSLSYVAMDNQFNGMGLEIDVQSGQILRQVPLDLKMPLYSYAGNSGFLVLGHDFINRSSEISLYSTEFTKLREAGLNINTDLQNIVQKHLNKSGKQYPFFIGPYSGNPGAGYFVNCFSNYSLRVVFLDEAGNLQPGDIYSFQTEAAVSSFVQQEGSRFSLTRYYGGNNFLIPEIEVQAGVSQNFNAIDAVSLYELSPDAPVVSINAKFGEHSYMLFASQTNSNSLIIYQYDPETDEQVRTWQRDFNQKIEVADIIQTEDEGIVILGKIFVLGKFPRPLLVKIPSEDFNK
jgi:hypothetical protein